MTTTPKTRPAAQRIDDACDLLDEATPGTRIVKTYDRAAVVKLCGGMGYSDDIRAHGFDPIHAREFWYDDTSLTVVCDVRLPVEAIDDEEGDDDE